MKRLNLPVSLVVVETLCHDLARFALQDCFRHADFAEVLIFSDRPRDIWPDARCFEVPNWPNIHDAARFVWYGIHPHLNTSHMFFIHWDSWIIDPEMWRPDFLDYDWVGPPWWYDDGMNVGGSAFALRSVRLMKYLAEHRDEFPYKAPEDNVICREYRPRLEAAGFRWPTDEIAFDLAFECTRPSQSRRHFGFHKIDNWPLVMSPRDLLKRTEIAVQNPYLIRSGSINRLFKQAPYLMQGFMT